MFNSLFLIGGVILCCVVVLGVIIEFHFTSRKKWQRKVEEFYAEEKIPLKLSTRTPTELFKSRAKINLIESGEFPLKTKTPGPADTPLCEPPSGLFTAGSSNQDSNIGYPPSGGTNLNK